MELWCHFLYNIDKQSITDVYLYIEKVIDANYIEINISIKYFAG